MPPRFWQRTSTRLAAALSTLALLGAVTGCTGAAPAAGPAAPTGPKVNRLLLAMPAPAREGSSPNMELDPLTVFQVRPMLEWLIGYAPDGKFYPMLSTGWSVEPDGKSLRFKLRKGIPFHGGVGDFSAQDVAYSFEQITRPDAIHPHSPAQRRVKVEVINDAEVVFRLTTPNAEYLNMLSEQSGGMAITSKADAGILGSDASSKTRPLASTGPYQFTAREQGRSMTFSRVPYQHYRATPDFPELQMTWISEASTRLASLLTGEVHITQLPQDLTPQAVDKGMKLLRGPISAQRTWLNFQGVYLKDSNDMSKGYMWPEVAFADVRVRKAMNRAIDREALNKAFFANKAEMMYIDKMPRKAVYFNPAWETNFKQEYGYDLAAAQALLAEAGYGPGKPLKIKIRLQNLPDYGGSEDLEEAIAGYWRKAGIEPELVNIQETEYRNINDQFGWKDMITVSASSNFDIQGWRVYNSSIPPRSSLELKETDPIVQELLQTMDENKQNDLLRKAGDVSYPLHMNVPLFWLPAELIVNPTIVEAWPYPGSISRIFSHFETIKAAR